MDRPTFAFLHGVAADDLARFRTARPEIDFVVADGVALPDGIERARGATTSWNGPALETILAAAPRLEWLHQRGAGIDRIPGAVLQASTIVSRRIVSTTHAPLRKAAVGAGRWSPAVSNLAGSKA